MALDGIYLRLLKQELEQLLVGSRVEKIHEPTKNEFVFHLRSRTGGYKLLLSASGSSPRINITENPPENPANPPMLCMLFRKHLSGAVLKGIEQNGLERVLLLRFDAVNEIGDRVLRTVAVEIMAAYSNIILIDDNNVIIDSIKRVDNLKSSVREILPGREYISPPPQEKLDLTTISADEAARAVFSKPSGIPLSSAILKTLEGVSPLVCRELALIATGGDPHLEEAKANTVYSLAFFLDQLKLRIEKNMAEPYIYYDKEGSPVDFCFMPLAQYSGAAKAVRFDTLSEALDEFYFEKDRLLRINSRASDLFKLVNKLSERTARKLEAQRAELEQSEDRELKKIYAELINANLYRLKKGDSVYVLENFYDEGREIRIPARPELTPAENARQYYKEFRKAQTAEKVLREQIEKGFADINYFETVLDALSRANSDREIDDIRRELAEGGYIKDRRPRKGNEKMQTSLSFIELPAPDGFKVLIGRNNTQNDRLSFKKANKNDIWFHTQKIPGSHVILVTDGREPTEAAMEFAAACAATFSSAKNAPSVPVDYTEVKNLKKPPGARPGFVIYHVYNTMMIKPLDLKALAEG